MLLREFLRQPGAHQLVGLLHVMVPLFAIEFVDVFDEHPLVTRDVRRGTYARRTREFIKLFITHLERYRQWSIQRSDAKHLARDGETEVVSPFHVFGDGGK